MKYATLLLFGLMLPLPAQAEEWKSEWSACTQNTDCTAIKSACDSWQAVNKSYRAPAETYIKNITPVTDCPEWTQNYATSEAPPIICHNSVCTWDKTGDQEEPQK